LGLIPGIGFPLGKKVGIGVGELGGFFRKKNLVGLINFGRLNSVKFKLFGWNFPGRNSQYSEGILPD